MKVLVTRPLPFAENLCQALRDNGHSPILFPTIEIQPRIIDDSIQKLALELNHADMAIFISRPSVLHGIKLIKNLLPALPQLQWAAIGPGTAKELEARGISSVLFPESPPFESEHFLALPSLKAIQGKQIALFRGNQGRTLLAETLRDRGATVIEFDVYQRTLPRKESLFELTIEAELPEVVVTCSVDALKNLKTLTIPKLWEALKTRPFILIGLRMDAFATNLGIRYRVLAKTPEDKEIINVLTTLRNPLE